MLKKLNILEENKLEEKPISFYGSHSPNATFMSQPQILWTHPPPNQLHQADSPKGNLNA